MNIQPFATQALVRRGTNARFVIVQVYPIQHEIEAFGIKSQEEYASLVHYMLAKEEELLTLVAPDFPEAILYNEQSHPEPVVTFDLTRGNKDQAAARRCRCIRQPDGGYACIWYPPR